MRQQPAYGCLQLDHDRQALECQAHVAELQWQQRQIMIERLWSIKHM
jgi:hypothetical protein